MSRSWMLGVLAIGLVTLAAACGPQPSVDSGRGSGSPEPSPCAAEQTRLRVDRWAGADDGAIARELGVPVEEVQMHTALSDHVGRLAAKLNKYERKTYADLEIIDEPDLRVVVYFTEDREEMVRPYVRCTPLEGFVEVRTDEASIAELEAAQNEAYRLVTDELSIRADSDIDITKNRAEIYVTDKERLEAALRESGQELPEHVAVVEVGGLAQPM